MLKPSSLLTIVLMSVLWPKAQAQLPDKPQPVPDGVERASGAFPSSDDLWPKTKIRLVRHGCLGACPQYSVTVFGNGKVLYEGSECVRVKGKRTARLEGNIVHDLVRRINEMHFFSAVPREEQACVTDGPTASVIVSEPGRERQIDDYCIDYKELEQLEEAIDKAVEIQRWVFINATELKREIDGGWDVVEHGQEYTNQAIDWDDPQLIQLLVKNGVPVDTKDQDGNTFLFRAVLRNRYKAAKALLELGANPKTRDFNGEGPAQNAGNRSIEMCKLFLDHGVGIDDQDGGGETMLMNAVNLPENFDIVKFLVKSGASINVRNKDGETALGIATRAKQDFQQRIDITFDPKYPQGLGDPERARAEMTATLQEYQAVLDFLKQNGGEE